MPYEAKRLLSVYIQSFCALTISIKWKEHRIPEIKSSSRVYRECKHVVLDTAKVNVDFMLTALSKKWFLTFYTNSFH